MFGLSTWHVVILLLVGLFVFGPERLPTLLRDFGKALRQVRSQAQAMQEDLKAELGPEVGDLDLRSLHPKTFVQKHLFGDEEDPFGLDVLGDDEPATSSAPKTGWGSNGNGQHARAAGAVSFDKGSHSDPVTDAGPAPVTPVPAPIDPDAPVKYDYDAT